MNYSPTIKSFFSGAGGLDLGLSMVGCNVVESLEYDQRCVETLSKNFTHKIMAFTYPCTKYSTIADIHGTRTGDELFLHAFRHVALKLPEAFVIENVPGMKKFQIVMECFTRIPNYYVNVFCPLNASNWLPQRRDRLIIIATRKPFSISAPKAERRVKLKDIVQKNPSIKIPDYVFRRLEGKYRDMPIICVEQLPNRQPLCG